MHINLLNSGLSNLNDSLGFSSVPLIVVMPGLFDVPIN